MVSIREETTQAFLLCPALYVLFNVVLAVALSFITIEYDKMPYLRGQARTMIGLLTSASISIVTLTFSLTVLSIQIAAQTYSPRLLDDFLKDPISTIAVAVNLGAFAYGYTLLYFLNDGIYDDTDEQTPVPFVAIHVVSLHMLFVLFMFVYFIHYFINGFRLERILYRAGEQSWKAAQALEAWNAFQEKGSYGSSSRKKFIQGLDLQTLPKVPPEAFKVLADHSGYVSRYTLRNVVEKAAKLDICIRYHANIGEFVAEGTLLAYAWDVSQPPKDENSCVLDKHGKRRSREMIRKTLTARILSKHSDIKDNDETNDIDGEDAKRAEELLGKLVASGVEIATARDGEMDVLLGVQQLTDVAVRALSAAVNDPMSAIQSIDYLSTLFGRLTRLRFLIPYARDSKDNIRAWAPRRSFAYLLSVLDTIRFYGGSDLQVSYRLMRFYGDLGAILKRLDSRDERLRVVLAQMEQCLIVANKHFPTESCEWKSIREVYEYSIDLMSSSDGPTLQLDESLEMDLNELETTYLKPSETFLKGLPAVLQEVNASLADTSNQEEKEKAET